MPNLAQYPYLEILKDLAQKKGIDVFLVGGFLRDSLLGSPTRDLDFATPKDAIALAKIFSKKIKGVFVLLDDQRGCGRVVKKVNDVIETYDFADFRASPFKKDLYNRDFTVNTLFVNIKDLNHQESLTLGVKDLFGGRKDLKAKVIRMVSTKVFKDDPLRLLRAYSLKAKYGFRIEAKTVAQIKKDKNLLRQVASERILDELFKVLESPRAFENLLAMDKIGLLENIIPQITIMYEVTQGGYHHLDVWPHSLETVRQLEGVYQEFAKDAEVVAYLNESLTGCRTRRALLKLGALLHDIGKPETRKQEVGRMSFHSHEHVGKRIVRTIANQLKLSARERMMLEDVVQWHLRPGYLSNFKIPSERMYFRYFRDTHDEAVSIALLSLADQRSTRGPLTSEADQKHHEKICRDIVRRYFVAKKEKPLVPLVNGHDLIKKLKLKPSPIFGRILKELEEAQAMGKIATKDQALALAAKILLKENRG